MTVQMDASSDNLDGQMAQLFTSPFTPAFSATGALAPLSTLTFYLSGTTTLADIYTDETLSTELANPITADAGGLFPPIYLDPDVTYRVVLTPPTGTPREVDPLLTGGELQADITGPNGTAMVGHEGAGASAATFAIIRYFRDRPHIFDSIPSNQHNGLVAGTAEYDCGPAILDVLSEADQCIVPKGRFPIVSTVTIEGGKGIVLDPGATVTRLSSMSAATTPIFHLTGAKAVLRGAGSNSLVTTQNRAPNGVVLMGYTSMTDTTTLLFDQEWAQVRDLSVFGSTNYGQTSGDPDACIKIINPQLAGLVSYFPMMNNLFLRSANYGLWMQGWGGNGGQFRDIAGKWIGNSTLSSARALFYMQGVLEINLSSSFHHYSPGTPTIKVEDLDNTATSGGSLHVSAYNITRGIICEQDPGVGTALALLANSNCTAFKNRFEISDNVSLGYDISTFVRNSNAFWFSSTGLSEEFIDARKGLTVGVAGYGLKVKEGSNAKMGIVTLVAGTATVATTAVAANSRIFLTSQVDGGTPGHVRVSTRTAGTSFTITSSSASDTSQVAWHIVDPAP